SARSSGRSRSRLPRVAALVLATPLALGVGGCAFCNTSDLRAERHPVGALGSGFVDPASPPAPEATIRPKPGSWDAVRPPRGYRVVLLTAGDDPPTTTLVRAVHQWARAEQVRFDTVAVPPPKAVDGIVEAMNLEPTLLSARAARSS